MEVEGRVAVVTGAAGGIGAALAARLADAGARVAIADLDAQRLAATAAALGPATVSAAGDVADERFLRELLTETSATHGPVDLFFANAGVWLGPGLEADDDAWARTLDVNVLAHVRAARLLVPQWLERGGGYFIATASAAGLLSQIGSATYSVSKHAAVAFAEWLSITYGDRGLRVSCLCPMGVATDLLADALTSESSDARRGAHTVTAAGDVLQPDDVAATVLAAVADERFLILPHPEVLEYFRRRAADHDRWLAGMRRMQARVGE